MPEPETSIEQQLEQRRQDLEDIRLRPDKAGDFLTVFATQNDIELALRLKSSPAARKFIQSYHTGHTEALQKLRGEEVLAALYEDLHEARMTLIDVYQKEIPLVEAGDFDEEDLAMHETLKRRINKMEDSILTLAEMKSNPEASFLLLTEAADQAKQAINNQKGAKDWSITP